MDKIIEHYGGKHQLIKCVEEAAEFIHAISKYYNDPTESKKYHIKEELADLYLMLEQVQLILNIPNSEVEWMKEQKILRECRRIAGVEDDGEN